MDLFSATENVLLIFRWVIIMYYVVQLSPVQLLDLSHLSLKRPKCSVSGYPPLHSEGKVFSEMCSFLQKSSSKSTFIRLKETKPAPR